MGSGLECLNMSVGWHPIQLEKGCGGAYWKLTQDAGTQDAGVGPSQLVEINKLIGPKRPFFGLKATFLLAKLSV